jgi:polar amino acid transport system permease protein
VLPDLVSNTVERVKLTTLASVVSTPERLPQADLARSYDTSPLILASLICLVLLWPVVWPTGRLEHFCSNPRRG